MTRRIFIVAAESSGDVLGADLVGALRARSPDVALAGVGGPALESRGLKSAFDIKSLAILGLIDGVKAYPRVVRLADKAADAAVAFAPDTVVLIDSWGFTLRVAQRLRKRLPGLKLVKYIGPQVWASRPGRAKTLARTVDHLICIHDFELPFYTPFNLPCTVCGHPALGRYVQGDGGAFRARHGLGDAPLLLVLPGSRGSELRRTAPRLFAAAGRLCADIPSLKVVVVAARSIATGARAMASAQSYPVLVVDEAGEKEDAFAAGTAALAVSGTVTTEVGLQGTPVVVGYRLGWITWALARLFLYKSPFMTLMNVAAAREIAPEFIQTRCTAEILARAAAPLLRDPAARSAQVDAQDRALKAMGRGGRPAADIAAEAVLAIR
ncbi:MAG: lipid-A-disaccharide synthase [Hyphomonadaceae bacterium]|nr:MAG: lipid-A-disaccharide synthase [Caulobacteraceae bacterium]MBT9445073.1 lipid-A-disaccharide synthase [Hyphomonadaceae bacterium]TPW08919.1 MAG: lipid-A-disaccharide synthase [Alphaproteobacteria bacterium]